MIDCEDPELSADEIVARAVMIDTLEDEAVRLAIVQKCQGDVQGEDSPALLVHRPCRAWVKTH